MKRLAPDIAGVLHSLELDGGVNDEVIPAVFQAYVRAISRIVAAEASAARMLMAATPSEDRATVLVRTIDRLLPVASRSFDVVHRLLLLEALIPALGELEDQRCDEDAKAIAMIDLVDSTKYLRSSGAVELRQLVDALFQASQTATAYRNVHVVKYVGDGVFLAGRDVVEVADAALEVITRLQHALPLRARGSLTWGLVLEHAGDLFGLPINVAHALTKSARPGMLLASAAAGSRLPAGRRGRYRTLPGAAGTRVATVKDEPVSAP